MRNYQKSSGLKPLVMFMYLFTRIYLQTDLILQRRRHVSAGLHATDTLWHACIDFLTYSDDHPSQQSGVYV